MSFGTRTARRWAKQAIEIIRPPMRERVGYETDYNLYRYRPLLRLLSKGRFLSDTSPDFPEWVETVRELRRPQRALILGNAPCLNDLDQELFQHLRQEGYFTIGLNRSIYTHQTDVLLWSDLRTIDDILRKRCIESDSTVVLHALLERDHRLRAKDDPRFQGLHQYWSTHKNFRDWPKTKLYMFRNVSTAALHLCYRLNIRDVLMVGFGFDDRTYFYKTEQYKKAKGYEILSDDQLSENCGGYTTQRIVSEILQYLIHEEGFTIRYNGNSQFLSTVPGLINVDLRDRASLTSRVDQGT